MSFMAERSDNADQAAPGGTRADPGGPQDGGRPQHAGPGRRRRPRPSARTAPRALAVIAFCAAVVGLFACYQRVSATFPVGSDGASNALEAWDLLHGNWLLRGWTFTDVSFYTTELPEYAAVEWARGLNTSVVHAAAAITYTLLVLTAAALARGRSRGPEGWARALIAGGIMLAPQLGNGIHVLLSQPDHVGTQVPLLGIFLLLDRVPRRWHTVAAIWALLVVTIVADKIAIMDAAVPLVVVCLFYAARARTPLMRGVDSGTAQSAPSRGRGSRHVRNEAGTPAQGEAGRVGDRVSARSFELLVACAAIAAVGAAELILLGISRLGGFTLLPVETRIVTPAGLPGHLSMTLVDTLNLFGAGVTTVQPGPQTAFAWLHLPGVALATAALGIALWRMPFRRDLVSDVLAVGLVVNLADFIASAIPSTPFDTRELVAVLPYGAVLAGRIFGPWLAGGKAARIPPPRVTRRGDGRGEPGHSTLGRFSRSQSTLGRSWRTASSRTLSWHQVAVAVVALVGVCQLSALGYGATRPPAANPEQALAGWLAEHHLITGLGTYTEDNVTTLDSGGAVRLRTVSWPRSGRAVPRLYQSSASWYDPRKAYANFVVSGAADRAGDLIPRAEILALAGPPARTYRFQSFTIMVWNKNLLTLLAEPSSRLPGEIGHP